MPHLYTHEDTSAVINALRTAADKFAENAKILDAEQDGLRFARLSDQFKRQERQARELADKIENAEGDTILPQCW